jgi:hypothetical protein
VSEPFDVNRLITRGTVELAPSEHPDERASRLRREERRDRFELAKNAALFTVILVGMTAVAMICGYLALIAEGVDEPTRGRAHTLFISVVSGGVAYLFGRASKG